jgi:hypothetical protein
MGRLAELKRQFDCGPEGHAFDGAARLKRCADCGKTTRDNQVCVFCNQDAIAVLPIGSSVRTWRIEAPLCQLCLSALRDAPSTDDWYIDDCGHAWSAWTDTGGIGTQSGGHYSDRGWLRRCPTCGASEFRVRSSDAGPPQ